MSVQNYGDDVEVECYKAKLVAKGFTQINLQWNLCTCSNFFSIHCTLALAAIDDMKIHQKDIKITFLNCDLEEEMHIEQSQGFTQEGGEHLVCKLHKSLYGLK